jgi:hypothetical protein
VTSFIQSIGQARAGSCAYADYLRSSAMANGVKFGRKPKLSPYQRAEAVKRRAAGETLASIARSYAVDLSMISKL